MISIRPTTGFQRAFKKLAKKYRNIEQDLAPLISELEVGDFSTHDAIAGFENKIYKARVASRDQGKGKSGGFRVVYFNLSDDQTVFLLTIYAKANQMDIDTKAIKAMLTELGL